jgi:hypothetical protein
LEIGGKTMSYENRKTKRITDMKELSTAFDTTKMRVMIESIAATGSAFGSNEDGDIVFLNKRLVDKVGLEMGDVVEAHAIPNYEDKRDSIPWRGVRVSMPRDAVDTPNNLVEEVKVRTSVELDQEILEHLSDEEVSYWTATDLAAAADTDTVTVGNSCNRLFQQGRIARADVHARPGQKRVSFFLWALDVEGFR